MHTRPPALPWIHADQPFTPPEHAWGPESPAPGLVCAGADLSRQRLLQAYRQGLFPWFGPDQPILWWSPDPRMVLRPQQFRLHRALRKTLRRFLQTPGCEVRIDHAPEAVLRACALSPRPGQPGTWIVPTVRAAYLDLQRAGFMHSVETWVDGRLVGGLYAVAIGRAVFGESMFHHRTDASKIALAALVGLCRAQDAAFIDCQQQTAHLASLGAAPRPRVDFLAEVHSACAAPALDWSWTPRERPSAWQALGLTAPDTAPSHPA